MNYEGTIIRPPSEAASLILQVAVGCSHNKCTFCPAYKKKIFRIKDIDEIYNDIDDIVAGGENYRRVFLCDGDPLCMPQEKLVKILDRLGRKFVRLQRVGIYACAKSILEKSAADLSELKAKKMGIVYLGLESGDRSVLNSVAKGAGPEQMIAAAGKVKQAGIKLNVTVILGLAGKAGSRVHATQTMKVLNRMQPNHVGALTLMLVPGTQIYDEFKAGRFILADKFELLQELRTMLAGSQLKNCLFFSNHASNYFPLKARLPRDKDRIINLLDNVISSGDGSCLRDEAMRGL